ncbi:hypothetical protein P280DRAFT_506322 [Massarina eburnea CBS 473.64]|uniref:Uncharacterized protein n=1 Tax=Massarina eburnea CBS 473.64 TaxID=1395130 RepID=A0A6A6S3U4_9PLEO|nr:hypothetical protein P280DRAFT_506322 [Massarina eburnea CBS 473.64]
MASNAPIRPTTVTTSSLPHHALQLIEWIEIDKMSQVASFPMFNQTFPAEAFPHRQGMGVRLKSWMSVYHAELQRDQEQGQARTVVPELPAAPTAETPVGPQDGFTEVTKQPNPLAVIPSRAESASDASLSLSPPPDELPSMTHARIACEGCRKRKKRCTHPVNLGRNQHNQDNGGAQAAGHVNHQTQAAGPVNRQTQATEYAPGHQGQAADPAIVQEVSRPAAGHQSASGAHVPLTNEAHPHPGRQNSVNFTPGPDFTDELKAELEEYKCPILNKEYEWKKANAEGDRERADELEEELEALEGQAKAVHRVGYLQWRETTWWVRRNEKQEQWEYGEQEEWDD